jgi:hypothetical protein
VANLETDSKSIPALPAVTLLEAALRQQTLAKSPGILAAEANYSAREQRARGDREYTWRPTVTFGAQYGRVSPINDVNEFYNLHGNYNTANVGFQVVLPILDRVRSAAAKESYADAYRAKLDLANLVSEQADNQEKLRRSVPELVTKAELADLDFKIAQSELNSTTLQLRGAAGRPVLTPKEEATAHIEERQKYLDLLDTRLQAAKAEITLLRQSGQLAKWVDSPASANNEDIGSKAF